MRQLVGLCVLVLWCSGCDSVVCRSPEATATYQVQRDVSCSYVGYCYGCDWEYDSKEGHYDCGFDWRFSCPGHRLAEIEIKTFDVVYESGRKAVDETTRVVRHLTACS